MALRNGMMMYDIFCIFNSSSSGLTMAFVKPMPALNAMYEIKKESIKYPNIFNKCSIRKV